MENSIARPHVGVRCGRERGQDAKKNIMQFCGWGREPRKPGAREAQRFSAEMHSRDSFAQMGPVSTTPTAKEAHQVAPAKPPAKNKTDPGILSHDPRVEYAFLVILAVTKIVRFTTSRRNLRMYIFIHTRYDKTGISGTIYEYEHTQVRVRRRVDK